MAYDKQGNLTQIRPSAALCNDYAAISNLAHEAAEPIFFIENGEGDFAVRSSEAFERREELCV